MNSKKLACDFFCVHRVELEGHYPGINLRTFQLALNDFIRHKGKDPASFFSEVQKGVPFAYLVGRHFFYQSEFIITPDVLIPRFETEILIHEAVGFLQHLQTSSIRIADIGTGSGNVILSILKELKLQVSAFGTDISAKALEVARLNENFLQLTTKVSWIECDRLDGLEGKYNLIVTNPPYIKVHADRAKVHQQVVKYEPPAALFLEDGIYDEWFAKLFHDAHKKLCENGQFLMEGHEDHLEGLALLARKNGFLKTEVLKDLSGRDRFLRASCTK